MDRLKSRVQEMALQFRQGWEWDPSSVTWLHHNPALGHPATQLRTHPGTATTLCHLNRSWNIQLTYIKMGLRLVMIPIFAAQSTVVFCAIPLPSTISEPDS